MCDLLICVRFFCWCCLFHAYRLPLLLLAKGGWGPVEVTATFGLWIKKCSINIWKQTVHTNISWIWKLARERPITPVKTWQASSQVSSYSTYASRVFIVEKEKIPERNSEGRCKTRYPATRYREYFAILFKLVDVAFRGGCSLCTRLRWLTGCGRVHKCEWACYVKLAQLGGHAIGTP